VRNGEAEVVVHMALAIRVALFMIAINSAAQILGGQPAVAGSSSEQSCAHNESAPTPLPPQRPLPRSFSEPPVQSTVSLLPAPLQRQFGIRVYSSVTSIGLHPERARLTLTDAGGRVVGGQNRFRFDPCIPYPLPSGSQLRAGLPDYWIGFHFNSDGLAAGVYHIAASLQPGFATSNGRPIPLNPDYGSQKLAVYVSPPLVERPRLVPGQQFIAMPRTFYGLPATDFTDRHGTPVPAASQEGRILTLVRLDKTRVEFQSEGVAGPLYLARPVDATSMYGLYPLVSDNTVLRLRRMYVGKRVWGYGGLNVYGGGRMATTSEGLPISAIYRVYGYARTLNIGGPFEMNNLDLVGFVALDPLVIRFGGPAVSMMSPVMGTPIPRDTVAYSVVSGAWDFERLYSPMSMTAAHPSWSTAIVSKIQNQKVETGMTKDMIAWMFGYPSAFGTVEQVRKLDTWEYAQPAPFSYTVHFRNGVVVKFDPPGNLP